MKAVVADVLVNAYITLKEQELANINHGLQEWRNLGLLITNFFRGQSSKMIQRLVKHTTAY